MLVFVSRSASCGNAVSQEGLVPLAEATLSPLCGPRHPAGSGSATTSCRLSCLTLHSCPGALHLLFSLSGMFFPFQGFCLFFLPSIIHISLQAASQRGSLSKVSGPPHITRYPSPLLYYIAAHQPHYMRACVCMCPVEWPPAHGAVHCQYAWMTTSPAPSFLSVV